MHRVWFILKMKSSSYWHAMDAMHFAEIFEVQIGRLRHVVSCIRFVCRDHFGNVVDSFTEKEKEEHKETRSTLLLFHHQFSTFGVLFTPLLFNQLFMEIETRHLALFRE